MKLAIMQPYFFPYLGYFQLIAAVDKFAFYDDVNFIKNGWINRNRICLAGAPRYITVPLAGASPFQKIDQVELKEGDQWRKKMIESIRHAYSRAPNFTPINSLVCDVLHSDVENIADLAKASVVSVCNYLQIKTEFVSSSRIYRNDELSGEARVIDICRQEAAGEYWNLPGGRDLYDRSNFCAAGIQLNFVDPTLSPYPQGSLSFHKGLSIIDVLMFNARDAVQSMLA